MSAPLVITFVRQISHRTKEILVGWLFGFYGITTFVGYITPNQFL